LTVVEKMTGLLLYILLGFAYLPGSYYPPKHTNKLFDDVIFPSGTVSTSDDKYKNDD